MYASPYPVYSTVSVFEEKHDHPFATQFESTSFEHDVIFQSFY